MADNSGAVCQFSGHSVVCPPDFPGCMVWLQRNPISAPTCQTTRAL